MSKTVKIKKYMDIKYSRRVSHKNRFWANGAKKIENYGNSSSLACPLSFLVKIMIPLPNLVCFA